MDYTMVKVYHVYSNRYYFIIKISVTAQQLKLKIKDDYRF